MNTYANAPPRYALAIALAVIIVTLASSGCGAGDAFVTAITGKQDPNALYAEYEENYDAYHLNWLGYQLALEQAHQQAAASGRETALLAQELQEAADALDIAHAPLPADAAGSINLASLGLTKILKAEGIPETSGQLPSDGALGLIAEYGFTGITAIEATLAGGALALTGSPLLSTVVVAVGEVAKKSLDWILREIQARDEVTNYFRELNSELESQNALLDHETQRLAVVSETLQTRRAQIAGQRTDLQFAMRQYYQFPELTPQLRQAVGEAAAAIIQIPLAHEPALNEASQ